MSTRTDTSPLATMPGFPTSSSRRQSALVLAVIAVVFVLLPLGLSRSLLTIVIFAMTVALLGFAVSAVYSTLGLMFFGTGGFAIISSYIVMIGIDKWGWPLPLVLLVAVVAPAVCALLIAPLIFRLSGIYFALITFAFAEVIIQIIIAWADVTGGVHGYSLATVESLTPFLTDDFQLGTYAFVAIALVIVCAAFLAFRHSRRGVRAIAIGDDRDMARALGIVSRPYQIGLFMVSGLICGVAGIAMTYNLQFIEPRQFGTVLSLEALTIVIVGGAKIVPGPIIGAGIVVVLPELLDMDPFWQAITYGVILIVVILLFPDGIAGSLHNMIRRRRLKAQER